MRGKTETDTARQNEGGGGSFVTDEYTQEFYADLTESYGNAAVIVPIVLDMLGRDRIKRVADFGCGTGQWLAVFRDQGCEVQGFDSDRVDSTLLAVPQECFAVADLTKKVDVGQRYDLSVSIEVAEHLDEQYAPTLIDTLTCASDIVLFSAAVPHQNGTHHVNCRWQSYWVSKFADRGYAVVDCVRPAIWDNKDLSWYYRQNMLIFCKNDTARYGDVLRLEAKGADWKAHYYDMINPDYLEDFYQREQSALNDKHKMMATVPMRIANWFCAHKMLHSIYAHTLRPLIKH